MTDEQGDPTARSLTLRSKGEMVQFSGLVSRGLDLSRVLKSELSPDGGGRLSRWRYLLSPNALADLGDKDLDKRAVAAKGIVELLGRIERDKYRFWRFERFILPLADSLHHLFESKQGDV